MRSTTSVLIIIVLFIITLVICGNTNDDENVLDSEKIEEIPNKMKQDKTEEFSIL